MLAESKAREVRAGRRLVLSLARLEHAHAQAVRRLEEFDEYLRDVGDCGTPDTSLARRG